MERGHQSEIYCIAAKIVVVGGFFPEIMGLASDKIAAPHKVQ